MRTIKFRAWDKKAKCMISVGKISFPANKVFAYTDDQDWGLLEDVKISELMQFTGLKDRNGVEIYEGDIVSIKSQYETDQPIDTKAKVEFSDGSFRIDFYAMILNWAVLEYTKSNWLIEVIGNIYESKNLLEVKR